MDFAGADSMANQTLWSCHTWMFIHSYVLEKEKEEVKTDGLWVDENEKVPVYLKLSMSGCVFLFDVSNCCVYHLIWSMYWYLFVFIVHRYANATI